MTAAKRCCRCPKTADLLYYCSGCRKGLVDRLNLPLDETRELKKPIPLTAQSRPDWSKNSIGERAPVIELGVTKLLCVYCREIKTRGRDDENRPCCQLCWGR